MYKTKDFVDVSIVQSHFVCYKKWLTFIHVHVLVISKSSFRSAKSTVLADKIIIKNCRESAKFLNAHFHYAIYVFDLNVLYWFYIKIIV